jgi:transposase/FtsZ-binding cell division protein ZapB
MKQERHNVNFPPEAVAEILQLRDENQHFRVENQQLRDENTRLAQELLYYKRFHFGRRSEKRMPEQPAGQLFLPFGEETIPEEAPDIRPIVEEIQIETHKRRKQVVKTRPKREEIPADIERVTRVIEPQEVDTSDMIKIGEDVREILQYIPGKFYVDRIVRPLYKSKKQDKTSLTTTIYQADPIETFIPKSIAGDTLLTQLIISKYADHLPVYRQLEIFKREGVKLSAPTICSWFHQTATQLYPLYERLAATILSSDYIQVDETTLPVIDEEKKRAVKGYLWTVRDTHSRQVLFHYDNGSRSQKTLVSLLRNYQGTVQSDGYEAYSIYENKQGVLLLGCWAHARRKFENALSEDRQKANTALDYIALLYQVEANLKEKNLSDEEIAQERKRLSYPILRRFEEWMHDIVPEILPKSLMGKAVSYTFSIYHRLVRYVVNGKYQIDNNLVENAIRPVALGRKNYLFCGNHDTAKDTALFYSFIVSCKQTGVNPQEWFLDILSRIKDCKVCELEKLLPAKWTPLSKSSIE